MTISELVYELVSPLLGAVARNHWLIHRLFGIRVPKHIIVHFDPTTLLLYRALQQIVEPQDKTALEIGIGQGALVSLAMQKSTGIDIQGVDCSESRVASSQEVAMYNELTPRFYQSDLFEDVPQHGHFDLIFFNPPYVPTSQGKRLQLTRRMRADADRVWDGGDDGSRVLQAFLQQARPFLTPGGRVLFGAQPLFLPAARIQEIADDGNWTVIEQVTRCCIPSCVYVLRPAAS